MATSPATAAATLLLFLYLTTTTTAVNFNCTGTTTTCRALVGYQPFNDTTYGAVQSLFQLSSLSSLLGANNKPTTTASTASITGNSTVFVPIPCRCAAGVGRSDRTPNYTVQASDSGLYYIAFLTFGNLITFQEIGEYNNLPDVNKITPGEKLWIPLPCSCDAVEGRETVHLAHRVKPGSSFEVIGEEFGVNASTIMEVNGISDPNSLLAAQILDVPLKACSSSINSSSLDYGLRLPNATYDITASDCIFCSCSAETFQLSCYQSVNTARCSIPKCAGNLSVGNTSTSGCETTTCSYAGYTNTSSTIHVLVAATNQSTCTSGVSSLLELRGSNWMAVIIIFLHMTWLSLL